MLDGRSGFRWDGVRSTSLEVEGIRGVKISDDGLVLCTEVLLRSRGGRLAGFSRKDELREKERSWCIEPLDPCRRRTSSSL